MKRALVPTAAILVFFAPLAPRLVAQDYDLVIRNARVVDGTGAPWKRADVAIRGDTRAWSGTVRCARR